jgi:hypothetical protein
MTADVQNLLLGKVRFLRIAVGAVIGKPSRIFNLYERNCGQTLTVGDDGTGADAPKR